MGAIVVQRKKNAQLRQKEKNTPQANWIRNDVSDAMLANKPATLKGSLLVGG